ncbi:MAG TPA: sterol desaturase family protein [Balneolales bacterium]|nr:sterol desaturase family protein [Balneolales bacterium]
MSDIKNQGQGTLFQNPALEALTKTSPSITLSVYIPIIGLLLYVGYQEEVVMHLSSAILIFLGAVLFWTLFEYLMHRYVFHFITESELVQKLHYTIHGVHHEYPRDKERLFMPPVPALIIISVLFTVIYMVMQQYVYIFLPGFLTGYLLYAFIHYATHSRHYPKFLKPIVRHHSLHHYKYPDKAFGVSSPLWDYIFRSMPPE